MKRTVLMMGSLLCAGMALADTFYVSTNGTSVTPYSSWATAATNIQSAVNVATNAGDTVWVTNGTYYLAAEIAVTDDIHIESVNGRDVTIVDGQLSTRCFSLGSNACVVSGFTITKGLAPTGSTHYGNAVYCLDDTPVVSSCNIVSNGVNIIAQTAEKGGGMYGGTATNCTFSDNLGSDGGGMYGGMATHCTFEDNIASAGGGMHSGTANHCDFTRNWSSQDGAGLYDSTATDCTIRFNGGANNVGLGVFAGGGMYGGTAIRCVLLDNESLGHGGGAYLTFDQLHCQRQCRRTAGRRTV